LTTDQNRLKDGRKKMNANAYIDNVSYRKMIEHLYKATIKAWKVAFNLISCMICNTVEQQIRNELLMSKSPTVGLYNNLNKKHKKKYYNLSQFVG
jgi:hypothetical protein